MANRIIAACQHAGLPGRFGGHSCRVGMAIDLATYNTPLVGVMQSGRWRHLRLELEGTDLVEGAPEDCQGHSGSSFSCQGQRPDRKARKPRNLLRVSYTLYSGLLPLLGCRRLYRGQPAMPRKQLNVTLTPEQYAAVQEAAAEEGVKVATFCCREAILARAMPEPELPDVSTLLTWLLDFLLFVTRSKTRPV